MLTHLSIRNLAIVKSLDIDLKAGMTAITGETGAGKSIAIDALGLCLGDRAEAGMVRSGSKKAEVSACFDLSALPQAIKWLQQHELDDEQECLIRRVVSAEGRSKAYINGTPAPLQQLKGLAQHLVCIHGQHAHQQLLKPEVQRQLLDGFAEHTTLLADVAGNYKQLQHTKREYQAMLSDQQQRADRRALLAYQVKELDEFSILENEFAALETEHKRLSHSQTLLEQAQLSFHQLYEAEQFNALTAVQSSLERISELQEHDQALAPIVTLLGEASINIDEAAKELRAYTEQLEIDPLKMQQVEARYSQALELARKHQIQPEHLFDFHQQLADEYRTLSNDEDKILALRQALEQMHGAFVQSAERLSCSRQKAANRLAKAVEQQIHGMNMTQATFVIDVQFNSARPPHKTGLDDIQIKVATNPGQAADTLDKVVSGGELSRIGLAIQVISSVNNQIPTMIFDEVDTGISGPTASVVGQLLRRLGDSTQVICVTHLPQVAACGHNQMFVTKFTDKTTTETHMISLSKNERIDELARLLAGDKLTDSAVANARELLDSQQQ